MFAIKYLFRISMKSNYAAEECAGVIWKQRYDSVEEALMEAQYYVKRYGYNPNDIRVVKVNE